MKNEKGFFFLPTAIAACFLGATVGVFIASGAANLKDPIKWEKLKTGVAEYVTNN